VIASSGAGRSPVILITGGVRSGKSAFAERLAREAAAGAAGGVVYVATSRVWDEEMAARVAIHQAQRPATWRTVEEPLNLETAVDSAGTASVVIVESIDSWVGNQLMDANPVQGEQLDRAAMASLEHALLAHARAVVHAHRQRRTPATLILVTLEAGLGVVPPYPLGRAFRDLLGRVNAALAAEADHVYLLVAGLPVDVKRLSRELAAEQQDHHQ
jgi:adenosylcobinamide kinase/adenosylcobinamide-phosphate guanylyltransferase